MSSACAMRMCRLDGMKPAKAPGKLLLVVEGELSLNTVRHGPTEACAAVHPPKSEWLEGNMMKCEKLYLSRTNES
jgi:hypothetical protein